MLSPQSPTAQIVGEWSDVGKPAFLSDSSYWWKGRGSPTALSGGRGRRRNA
jgi:hypothetical protein